MNYWYWFLGWFLCCSTNIYAQLPCNTQLDIISENTNGDATTVICNNSPLTLYASITPTSCPTCTYQWSTGSTNTFEFAFAPGTYSVTVTDNSPNGCVWSSTPVAISATTLVVPEIEKDSISICQMLGEPANPAVINVTNPCLGCTYELFDSANLSGTAIVTTTGVPTFNGIIDKGEYVVRVTAANAPNCQEVSRIMLIDTVLISVPPGVTTTYSLCDTNTAFLSTIDCNGCGYQWEVYSRLPEEKLVITGVMNGTRPGYAPSVIELYALDGINNLSQYRIASVVDGGSVVTYDFPAVSVAPNSYIYITDDVDGFQAFFGFAPNYVTPVAATDGNESIGLIHKPTGLGFVDVYGDSSDVTSTNDFTAAWTFENGWSYRLPDRGPNSSFVASEWQISSGALAIETFENKDWQSKAMPLGKFQTTVRPTKDLIISSVFTDTIGGMKPRGIQIKTLARIANLSDYSLDIYRPSGTVVNITLPSQAYEPGSTIFLVDDLTNFNNYVSTSVSNVIVQAGLSGFEGNHAVLLRKGGVAMDLYGDTTTTNWHLRSGIAKSVSFRNPSVLFNIAEWNVNSNGWLNCTDNNSCTSKLDMNGGEFRIHNSDLIISAIFDLHTNNTAVRPHLRGIELYAVDTITNLSTYTIGLQLGGTSYLMSPSNSSALPNITLDKGKYLYLVSSVADFNTLYASSFSSSHPFASANIHPAPIFQDVNFDGNDVVHLTNNSGTITFDISGDTSAASYSITATYDTDWAFQDGWNYRNNFSTGSLETYKTTEWIKGRQNYTAENYLFGTNRFPIQTYQNRQLGSTISTIAGADTSFLRVRQIGDYSVKITFPNGCEVRSDSISIDTAIFVPRILGTMLSSGDTSRYLSYLCSGSSVNLGMIGNYLTPPSWSYQWSRNGIDLVGETGYTYTATSPGIYQVRVVNSEGCTSYSNAIDVVNSVNGSNPFVATSSNFLCNNNSNSRVILTTPPCNSCSYDWFKEPLVGYPPSGNRLIVDNTSQSGPAGYYVIVEDSLSGCRYTSPIIEVSDTTYPAPLLTTSGTTVCSETPINISTTPCAGCTYNWEIDEDAGNGFHALASTRQAIERINTSGKYRLTITHDNGCQTVVSNTLQVTFKTVNANLLNTGVTSICNGIPHTLQAIPDSTLAPALDSFRYVFLRDGIPMQQTSPVDEQEIRLQGNYQVVITNIHNCSDTSSAISFDEVTIGTGIRSSANKICGPSSSVILEVDSCDGCTYQWYINNTSLVTQRDTFYEAVGYAAANNWYSVDVSRSGCVVSDSFFLESVAQRFTTIDIGLPDTLPTICDGSSIELTDTCNTCAQGNYYTYQWFLDGNLIPGASFQSYLVDTPGNYSVFTVDTNGCPVTSNTIYVQEFLKDPNLALDFTALGAAVPITYGRFDLNDHLQPLSLRNRGTYSSLTAQSAININTDTINVGIAGPGYHYITFSYTDSNALGSCTFSTFDTLYVLGSVSIDIANSQTGVPPAEACIGDVLDITLTNFTFVPNEVQFVTAGGGTISVPVTPVLTLFAGVFSGTFQVTVPQGARTGKIRVTDGSSSFESPNFFAINNPSVAVSLSSTSQPICSSLDSALFSGVPLGGSYSTYLLGNTTTPLATDSLLWLDSVTGYTNGLQYVTVYYQYTPTYTGTSITCTPITDSLLVEIRDASLDSVDYTPISVTQPSESLYNLTRVVYPISASNYPSSYTGTYVLTNNLRASTVPLINNTVGREPITYQVNNSGCVNQSVDTIDIWPKPALLDSIPIYLCSQADTVFIQRNHTTGDLEVYYRNNLVYRNSLYRYQENLNVPVGSGPDILYNEYINRMVVRSSNGGIDSINFRPPFEEYYFVPANVNGNSTQLTFDFSYSRIATYFSGGVPTNTVTTDYTIASVTKNFIIENPSQVTINPAILADTVFCPLSGNNQLLGIPAGGQFYINGGNLGYRDIPNNILNPLGAVGTTVPDLNETYRLTYVYRGQACVDSAAANIFLSDTFSISVRPGNVTGLYCETSPNDTILFELPYTTQTVIDTASAQFFVRGILSGTIFSPRQVGPPGDYEVRYVVSDDYGCTESARDTFTIFPIPDLAISTVAPSYCFNNDTVSIQLFTTDTTGGTTTFNEVTDWASGSMPGTDTAWFTGAGIVGGGQYTNSTTPRKPYFYAQLAGVGVHPMRYLYKDQNNCMDSINFNVEVLPLPQVRMTTTGGAALSQVYCENDSIPLFGLPIGTSLTSGYGSDAVIPMVPSSLDSANTAFKPNIPGTQPGHADETIFYFYEDNNGCRDTARYTIRIRNFTTDPVIAGLRNTTPNGERCADNVTIPVTADPGTGFDLDSLGWFSSDYQLAFSQLSDTLNTASTNFNPSLTGIEFADREVVLTFHYTDTSRTCYNSISDTVMIWALPHLTLSEQLVSNLGGMDYPGAQLIVPPTDTFYHMCESALEIPIYAYNTRGVFNPLNGQVTIGTPTHITPDTGRYIMGDGIRSNGGVTNIAYGFTPRLAGPGLDTIRYTFTDSRGCIDTIDHYLFVDSLPNLSFAGLSNYDTSSHRYIYCENDTAISILPSPIGVRWDLNFDNQMITSVPFDLRPDTLAVQGTYMDYILRYDYIGQVYVGGGICQDSLIDTIQIRPAPRLAWMSIPDNICMSDSNTRVPLSATPYGGTFIDITNNFQVTAGIVGDSLFNPSAQAGRRDIVYYYLDTTSGCSDTIQHTIYVYNQPEINFDIGNGCAGRLITVEPRTEPYGLLYNGVAVDSITQVIWNFGDGMIDTISYLPDTMVIPLDTHTYFNGGVYYPSLTVSNQGVCDTTFIRRIVVSPTVQPTDTMPYVQNFDTGNDGWFQAPADTLTTNGIITDSLWQWGIANGQRINTAQDGNFVWGTRLVNAPTTYRPGEHAWVYSPCFDLTELERPMIKLSLWKHTKSVIDGAILQFYDDSTHTWAVLGESGRGINWYDSSFVVSSPGNQAGIPIGWSGISGTWKDARYRLDNIEQDLRGRRNVRFRMAFASDPGTQLGLFDGVAFDSVVVGNRQRNVLVEHFSAVGYPGIGGIEQQLYRTIFNNLYGRDVNLIQYHLDNRYTTDNLYALNPTDNRQRGIFYGIQDADLVRVDGDLIGVNSRTSEILNYPTLEVLDVQMLKDPDFDIEFTSFPSVQVGGAGVYATIRVKALKDMPQRAYALHTVVTVDSMFTTTGDTTMAVMVSMFPDNNGTPASRAWNTGEFVDLVVQIPNITPALYQPNLIQLVAFVQNSDVTDRTIYQSASTRNLNAFLGPVDSLRDISVDQIEDRPGYEATQINIFPNPTTQGFNIAFDQPLEGDYNWHLVSISGQLLQEGQMMAGESKRFVSTDDLPSGVYVLIFRNEHVYTQRKIVVKRP